MIFIFNLLTRKHAKFSANLRLNYDEADYLHTKAMNIKRILST